MPRIEIARKWSAHSRAALPRRIGALSPHVIGSKASVSRGLCAAAVCLGLSACDLTHSTSDTLVYLPGSTPRLSARAERETQLQTGGYRDDIPEYTGAPGPNGERPAYVPSKRTTVFIASEVTNVESQATATAAEARAESVSGPSSTVSAVEIEQSSDGRAFVVLKEGQ